MTGDGFNHYMRGFAIDEGMITGKPGRTLCGDRFAPQLRVGSGGSADDPSLPICVACEDIYDGLEESNAEDREREALNA